MRFYILGRDDWADVVNVDISDLRPLPDPASDPGTRKESEIKVRIAQFCKRRKVL